MKRQTFFILGSLASISGLIAVYAVPGLLATLGRYVPQENIVLDYTFGVVWAVLIGLSILVWPVRPGDRTLLVWGWAAKSAVTLLAMLGYEFLYETDSMGYYFGGLAPAFDWTTCGPGMGTANTQALAWALARVFPDSFHLLKVTFSLVGFLALYFTYRAAVKFLGEERPAAFYALALFPTDIFWSSIIGKDPLILLGISVYLYGVGSWYQTGRSSYLLLVAAGVLESLLFRSWMAPILLAPLGVFVLTRVRSFATKVAILAGLGVFFVFASQTSRERFNIETTNDILAAANTIAHSSGWEGGSTGEMSVDISSPLRLILFLPVGIVSALFRPFPGEMLSVFGILAGLENAALLWLLWRAFRRTRLRELSDPKMLWSLSLILAWSSLYGVASFRNLGAASRFKLQILPVLLCVLLYLGRDRKAGNKTSSAAAA